MANNEDEGRFDFAVDFEDIYMYEIQTEAMCILFGVCLEWKFCEGACIEFVKYIFIFESFFVVSRYLSLLLC